MKALDSQLAPLLKFLDGYYAKSPALPKGGKDFLVAAAPWLALLGALFALFAAYGVYQLMTWTNAVVNNPYFQAYAPGSGGFSLWLILSIVVLLIWAVFYFLAFSPLRAKKTKGWYLILYGMLLNVLNAVVTLSIISVVFSIIGFLIGYYFLYQVKSYYS